MQADKGAKKIRWLMLTALAVSISSVIGCTPRYQGPEYLMSPRQSAPQPVYNRVTFARPPEVMPPRSLRFKNAPMMSPMIHLEVTDESMEATIKKLASLNHYRSYTAASIADKNISVDALGTVDEIADKISIEADVYISVDHANHEIRALPPKRTTKATLYK